MSHDILDKILEDKEVKQHVRNKIVLGCRKTRVEQKRADDLLEKWEAMIRKYKLNQEKPEKENDFTIYFRKFLFGLEEEINYLESYLIFLENSLRKIYQELKFLKDF
ncbi:MAG: hypothetical protein GF308_00205 [Candidatus Heimdallarchaeota archaeon]|nr:hypothetical protein [Candidatus Heimdallarchaeota archaeon]